MAEGSAQEAGDGWVKDLVCSIPLATKMLEAGDFPLMQDNFLTP